MKRDTTANWYRIRKSLQQILVHILLMLTAIAFVLPFMVIIMGSISDNSTVLRFGYRLWPVGGVSFEAYEFILTDISQILTSYRVSIVVTVVGTLVGLLFSSALSYTLARRGFRLRKFLSFLVYFTMLFSGGIVPYYMLVTQVLNVENTLWALILPGLVPPFYVLILRTNFAGLPEELLDAARVDGAGEIRIFFQIALPLVKPALATIGLFYVLHYWNDWFNPLLFIRKPELVPLQYMLYRIMANLSFLTQNMSVMPGYEMPPIPLGTIRMALAVLGAIPITILFLLLQRFFVRGLTLGAFKGV